MLFLKNRIKMCLDVYRVLDDLFIMTVLHNLDLIYSLGLTNSLGLQ